MSQPFDAWLGKQESHTDWAAPLTLRRLAALLDHDVPPWRENELPPLGHWLFHLNVARQSELGADGHPCKGGFLPPVTLPRRVWAGSRIRFLRSVAIGSEMVRRSTLASITTKSVASGEMTLVLVRHSIICDGAVAIEEEQDIAYLGAQSRQRHQRRASVAMPEAQLVRRTHATPELLFRYSALTFNAHRIHYDRDYACDEEHYAGLVVHGPLLATLLVDHYLRHRVRERVKSFSFRARAPVIEGEPFDLCMAPEAMGAHLWIAGAEGEVKLTAQIEADR